MTTHTFETREHREPGIVWSHDLAISVQTGDTPATINSPAFTTPVPVLTWMSDYRQVFVPRRSHRAVCP